MKLIDAEILIKRLWEQHQGILNNAELYSNADEVAEEVCNLVYIVDDMPTAFDTEKVVEQLEEVNMNYFLTIANTGSEKLDIAYGYASDSINKAIDIVKKGGVKTAKTERV